MPVYYYSTAVPFLGTWNEARKRIPTANCDPFCDPTWGALASVMSFLAGQFRQVGAHE
jgi:hypothetical protein